jgi:hypothetical protein
MDEAIGFEVYTNSIVSRRSTEHESREIGRRVRDISDIERTGDSY